MKILLLDVETGPNTAFVWGLFKENIPLARLIETSTLLCWSAKWYNRSGAEFSSIMSTDYDNMLADLHSLMSEADVIVTYNGESFDIPVVNREFLLHGFPPPAPYKSVDLYKTVKRKFRFVSNKLDHISKELGLGQKKETDFTLWVDCMKKDPKAWVKMEEYNKHDVVLLEQAYTRIRPWITTHPNQGLYTEEGSVCPRCGSKHYTKRGFARTIGGTYQRYQCNDCSSWFRDLKTLVPRPGKQQERFTNA